MKVLQINCVYGNGSTGKIVSAIHSFVTRQGEDSYVIYGMGEKVSDPKVFRTQPGIVRKMQSLRSRITGYAYGGCIWGTARALYLIKKIKPDIVHIHCINAYMVNIYRILSFLKKEQIPTVITNHAEFMYTGGCSHTIDCNKWLTGCYNCDKIGDMHPPSYFFDKTKNEWSLLKKCYNGFDKLTICCVSDWLRARAITSPFFCNRKIFTVFNGLDTDIFKHMDSSTIKNDLGLIGKQIVIHVTPSFNSIVKGGHHVLEMAKRFPKVQFIIIGDCKIIKKPSNCLFLGKITDQKILANYYSMADVCILTSIRETFSMVCAESLCCGTPVVGFEAGGPESISLKKYSVFVEQGNDDFLEKALKEMLERNDSKSEISNNAIKTYGQETMCNNYYNIYKNILR